MAVCAARSLGSVRYLFLASHRGIRSMLFLRQPRTMPCQRSRHGDVLRRAAADP